MEMIKVKFAHYALILVIYASIHIFAFPVSPVYYIKSNVSIAALILLTIILLKTHASHVLIIV
jgi:hypothetical protein